MAACITYGVPDRSPATPVAAGTFVRAFGTGAGGVPVIEQPVGVAVSAAGEVFVSDAARERIAVFDAEGGFRRAFPTEGGALSRPMHMAFGADGLLYVAEYRNDRISVFRPDGQLVRRVEPGVLDAPAAVAVDRTGALYVADFYHHRILVMNAEGEVQTAWGRPGRTEPGELHYPTDVALAPDGSLWVADAYNDRLQRFVEGRPIGTVDGFRVATGVAVDAIGRVYGVDFHGGRVQVLDPEGNPLGEIGSPGSGDGELDRPTDVAVVGERIYIADFGNGRIQLWRIADERAREEEP